MGIYKVLFVFFAVVVAVIAMGCSKPVSALEAENDYGYVEETSINLLCQKVNDAQTHIAIKGTFVNTSNTVIPAVVITAELVNAEKYPLRAKYETIATFEIALNNVNIGENKIAWTPYDLPTAEVYDLWASGQLGIHCYKIEII